MLLKPTYYVCHIAEFENVLNRRKIFDQFILALCMPFTIPWAFVIFELILNVFLSLADEEKIWPPCIRVIVIRSPVLQTGSLFIITAVNPATIGR